jgi:hypothetical protein
MTRKVVSSIDLARELAEVGIIPKNMLDNITNAKILIDPQNVAVLQLDIMLDSRIYNIMDPKARNLFTVETRNADV